LAVSGLQGRRATKKEGGTASCQRKEESRHVGGRRSRITSRKVMGGHAFRLTRALAESISKKRDNV
jgi:hypothetical protein